MKLGPLVITRLPVHALRRDFGFFSFGTWRHWNFGFAHPRTGVITVQKFGRIGPNWRNTHDTELEIDVADKSIKLFITYTFNAGSSDWFGGGNWNPGDPEECEIYRIEVVAGTKEQPTYTNAPEWLYDLLNDSGAVMEHIFTRHERSEPADYEYEDRA